MSDVAKSVRRGALLLWLSVAIAGGAPAPDLRVALIAGAEPASAGVRESFAALGATLEQQSPTAITVSIPGPADAGPSFDALRSADVAVLHGGTGRISAEDAALLREFLGRGKGLLVIRENTAGWSEWPGFATDVLGGKPKGTFAGGEPMRVINLFAHAVFTSVPRLETSQAMPLYEDLPADAMMIIEGTVGEATAPLAWLRRTAAGRIAHVLPSAPELFRSPEYRRLLANTVAWLAARPIPSARAIVQRTYLPDAYPGAFAITFPEGPTVCFDPWRGGVSQVADADFVDLRPRWITKRGEPARLMGALFFQDAGREGMWGAADAPEGGLFRFKGYSLEHAHPEFFYRVGDREIRETLRASSTTPRGVVRELHIGAGAQPLDYHHGPELRGKFVVRGAHATDRGFTYDSPTPGVVTLEINPEATAR